MDGLSALCKRRQWELNIIFAERLGWDEQIRIAARTTVSAQPGILSLV